MAKLICLLAGHNWTPWSVGIRRPLLYCQCQCKRCGKVWRI